MRKLLEWIGVAFLASMAIGAMVAPALGTPATLLKWCAAALIGAAVALLVARLTTPQAWPFLSRSSWVWGLAVFGFLAGALAAAQSKDLADAAARAQGFTDMAQYTDAHEAGFAKQAPYLASLKKRQAVAANKEAGAKNPSDKTREPAKAVLPLFKPPGPGETVLGRWINTLPGNGDAVSILKKDKTYMLVSHWQQLADASHGGGAAQETDVDITELIPRKAKEGRQFTAKDSDTRDRYTILASGALVLSDQDGVIATLQPVPGGMDDRAALVSAKAEQDVEAAKQRARQICRHSAQCWGQQFRVDADVDCQSVIERQAKYDYKWTDGLFDGPKFTTIYAWYSHDGERLGLVNYYGDKIKLQNGFGAWSNYNYVCTYDTLNKRVADVTLAPGYLPQ